MYFYFMIAELQRILTMPKVLSEGATLHITHLFPIIKMMSHNRNPVAIKTLNHLYVTLT